MRDSFLLKHNLSSLSKLVSAESQSMHRPRAVELGAGCGLTSIVLWLCGYDVIATDQPTLLPHLRRNIDDAKQTLLRQIIRAGYDISPGSIRAEELDWYREDSHRHSFFSQRIDLLVCADCCYSTLANEPLLRTIREVRVLRLI